MSHLFKKVSFIQKCRALLVTFSKTLGRTLKNTKKELENLEKNLKNAPKIAGNPGHGDVSRVVMVTCHVLSW